MDETLRYEGDHRRPDSASMIGALVGNYRLLEEIGRGGMGAVYRAEHVVMGRPAAVKVLLPEASVQREAVDRFFDEARATARLRHPAFVDVYDCGVTEDGNYFLVMEYLEGETLEALLERELALSPRRAVELVRELVAGLLVAHRSGIVHRDLKPSNVFLLSATRPISTGAGSSVKILDFGVAKLSTGGHAGVGHTRTGAILGTPLYMAPEQCRGQRVIDARADVYSIGCLLFTLVCGRPPFVYEGFGELIGAHVHEPPPDPRALNAAVPPALAGLVLRLLAKAPEDRPTSGDLAAALEALAPAMPDAPARPGTTVRRAPSGWGSSAGAARGSGRRAPLGLVALAMGGMAVGAALVVLRPRPEPPLPEPTPEPTPTSPWKARMIGVEGLGQISTLRVAVNEAGQAIVAWPQPEGGQVRAWANTFDRRTGWGTPARITAPSGGDVVELAVTIGPDGGGHVAWREEVGKGVDLWGTRFRPGQGWGTPARLEALEGRVDSLDAVGDGRGGAALVWRHEGAKSREAFVVQADAAGGWSAPRRLDPGKPRDVRFAQVGGTRDGRLTACWVRVVARGEELVVADFAPGRGWGRPQVVYVSEIGKIRFPDLAINEHGDVLAAWRVVDDEDDTVRVWTTSFSPAGGWAKPSLLTARDAKDAGWPKVGLSRDGVGLLVWREEDGTVQSTFARRFDAGKGWGEVQVIENQRLDTRHPELAMAASGRAFVVWDQSDRTHKDLWTNDFHPGRGWGEATLVETERGAVQEGKVAIAGDFAMIVWAQANRGGQILPWAATLD